MAIRVSLNAVDRLAGGRSGDRIASVGVSRGSEQRALDVAAPGQSPTVICTLGMHRSGTSLVSRILNLLGVYLGAPHDVSNVGADNPKGYWEHHPIALLNDELLARFGGDGMSPRSFRRHGPTIRVSRT